MVVSDAVWLGLFGLLAIVIKEHYDSRRAERAAREVRRVKRDLKKNNSTTTTKLDDIHTLVNSNMAAQMKVSVVALSRVAELTKNPDDIAAAEMAKKLLEEHESKQDKVDAGQAANKEG